MTAFVRAAHKRREKCWAGRNRRKNKYVSFIIHHRAMPCPLRNPAPGWAQGVGLVLLTARGGTESSPSGRGNAAQSSESLHRPGPSIPPAPCPWPSPARPARGQSPEVGGRAVGPQPDPGQVKGSLGSPSLAPAWGSELSLQPSTLQTGTWSCPFGTF